jgi:hypothetical protein
MNISFSSDQLEMRRYGRYLLPMNTVHFYYEDIMSWSILFGLSDIDNAFIFGERPPDMSAFYFIIKRSKNVFIFQHAKNKIRTKHTMGYYFYNRKRSLRWVMSIALLSMKNIFSVFKSHESNIVVYYFMDHYKVSLQRKLQKFDVCFVKCGCPDPTQYGTLSDIPVSDRHIECFYIDEPLDKTLGLSVERERVLMKKLISHLGANVMIYVKLHPRSDKSKYSDFNQFVTVDEVYKNCKFLCGYSSGLLDFDFNNEVFVKLNECLNWVNECSTKSCKSLSYLNDVLDDIKVRL